MPNERIYGRRKQLESLVALVKQTEPFTEVFALKQRGEGINLGWRLCTIYDVLLFDDPVAHVDDINVLSFLDHLRDLAINGSRQIFFATADTKLAGLFRHKFRFLGEEFKELPLSRT